MWPEGGGGGGGGFSVVSENFGERFDKSFPACALKKKIKCRPLRAHQSRYLSQDKPTVAQRAETTVDKLSLTSCACPYNDRWKAHSSSPDAAQKRCSDQNDYLDKS